MPNAGAPPSPGQLVDARQDWQAAKQPSNGDDRRDAVIPTNGAGNKAAEGRDARDQTSKTSARSPTGAGHVASMNGKPHESLPDGPTFESTWQI